MLGTPTTDDLDFITNPAALRYIKNLPKTDPINWEKVHSGANPVALDLLSHMVVFNPSKRYTI